MDEKIVKHLGAAEWQPAINLLRYNLENGKNLKEKGIMAFNLVVCELKLDRKDEAMASYLLYKDSMAKRLRKILANEFGIEEKKEEKTKITKEGEVESLAWFSSTTKFDEIIGCERAKKDLKAKVLGPMVKPDVYRKHGAPINNGIILYGPPGTGKTLLARALACEGNGKMLVVKINEITSKYSGDTAKNIHTVFEQARKGGPAIMFLDELDATAVKRESMDSSTTGPEERKSINSFLTELDGVAKENAGIFVIGATNRPWDIDSAFKRPGRFSTMIYIGPPSLRERAKLFQFYMKDKPHGKLNYYKLALLSMGMTPADIKNICENVATGKSAAEVFPQDRTAWMAGSQDSISMQELIREMLQQGEPRLFEWYAQTLNELKKQSMETINQYKELRKDIEFWYTKGKKTAQMYKAIAAMLK